MLERLATWFLNTYVAEYVGNINTDQLSIGILRGAVELEKLPLKKDALKKLNLPIEVKSGFIGKLRIEIPFRRLKSQPWVVQVDQLYLIAGPSVTPPYDEEAELRKANATKRRKLDAMEEQWREEQRTKGGGWFWSSFTSSFASNIAENLQIIMNDIHIRYEDSLTIPGHVFAVGMTMESLSAQSTDDQWEPKFMTAAEKARKLINLHNFAVYWDNQLLGDLEGTSLVDALMSAKSSAVASMDPMTCSTSTKDTVSSRFIIKPATGQARLVRNCLSRPLRLNEGPRFHVEINIDRVAVVVLDNQYNVACKMLDHMRLYSKELQYRKWRPVPENGNKLTGKQLWKYAINAILSDIQQKNWRRSPKFVLTRAHQNVQYVQCYVQYLTKSAVSKEVKERLAATEDDQSFEELYLLRQLAMNEVKQQRELAEAAKSRAQEQLPAAKRGWFSQWLPAWGEGSGGKGKGDEILAQPGEPPPSKEELEDELLDAIGYDPNSNNVFMRDRMLAVLSFTLREGSLQLSDTSGEFSFLGPELITELRFSELLFKLDYRPKMKFFKLDASLHSITMVDHLHPDSLFPTLVQPKGSSSSGSIGSIFWRQYSNIDIPDNLTKSEELLTISFTHEHHHRNHPHVTIKVSTLPLDIVFNSDTISRVKNFFMAQQQRQEVTSDWTEQLWLRLKELQAQTASEVRNQIEEMLLGEASKVKLTIDLDVVAPHLIIPEDFTSQDSSLMILDLGHFRFVNDKEQESSSNSNLVDDMEEDDDEFATPLSSPPSEEEMQQLSQPAPPIELQSALVQSISQTQPNISEKYLLTLSEFQVLVGKVEDNWKAAIKRGHSPLHIMDKFTLSVQIQRHLGFAVDTDISNLALSANLPTLSFHFDEQKVTTLISCANILTAVLNNTSPPPHTTPSDNSSPPSPPRDNPDTMGISMYYSVTESSFHPKNDGQPPPSQESVPSLRRLRRMTTFGIGSNSRMLVAVAQLLNAQLSIDRVELTLNSRGKNIIQLVVPGVNLSYLKRPYDSTFVSVIQNLCVVDQLQSFGPEFELLVCSNAYPLSSSTDTSSTVEQSVETLSSPTPLLSVSVSILTPFSPKRHDHVMQASSHDSNGLQLVSIKCSGLDVLVNQETAAELLSFFQRIFSHSSKPVEKAQVNKKPRTTDHPTSSLQSQKADDDVDTREVDAQFDRLTVRLVRGIQVPLTPSFSSTPSMSSSSFHKRTTCHLVGEISLLQLAVKASFSNEMTITGKLSSVNVRDLTNTGQKYSSVFSSGNKDNMTDASSSTLGDDDGGSSSVAALNFTITQQCSEECSEYHIDVVVAAMCYTHSTNFVSEVELFISEFQQYLEMVKNSLRSAAVGVAKGIVSDKSKIAEGLSKLSVSFGPHHSMKLLDEDSIDGSALDQQSSFYTDKCYIKINVQSPVIILPRSFTSNECLVAHLGEISFVNEPAGCGSVEDISSTIVDRAEVTVNNISLHATKSPEALSLVTSCRDTPNSKDCFKVLREASLLLRVDWRQTDGLQDEEVGVAETVEADVFDAEASTSEIVVSVTVKEQILLYLPKNVFDQAKSTLKNILRSRKETPVSSKEDMAQSVPTSPPNKKSVHFQTHVTTHTPQSSLPKVSANFSLPRLTLELKETIEEKERQLVFIDLKQFKVEVEQVEKYRTNFDLHLHSIVIEDLLQPKDSKYRYLFASSDKPVKVISPVATPVSSFKIPSAFQRQNLMVSSLANPLLSFSHYMSSPKPARTRTSPLRAFVPGTVGGDGNKQESDDEKDAAESSIPEDKEDDTSDMADSLRDLVCIRAYYIDKNCPDFQTKYDSISGHVDVDCSSVSVTVNLQTWVVLLDFFGIGIPTPPSSRSPSPPPSETASEKQQPLDMSSNVFGREQRSSSFSLKRPFNSVTNLPDSSVIDQMLSYHDFDAMATGNVLPGSPPMNIIEGSVNESRMFQSSHQTFSETTIKSTSSDASSVWGIEDKPSFQVHLSVHSLSVTFNKPEHPFAKGVVSGVESSVKYQKGNISVSGTLGQASVTDLTDTGAYYRERLTTTGDKALQFSIFKYAKPDPNLLRPYDISVSAKIASIRYLHTMRFLKELLAFCMHFPQLIDAFQRMKAVAQGNLVYNGPDRKPRVLLDVKMDGAVLLIPKHAFSPELACGNIDSITVSNRFIFDGKEGTFSYRRKQREAQHSQASKKRHSNKPGRSVSSVTKPNSTLASSSSVTSLNVESSVDASVSDSVKNGSTIKSPLSSIQPRYIPAPVDSNVSSFNSTFVPVYQRPTFSHSSRRSMSTDSMQSLMVERDRLEVEQRLAARSGPCLMDCIEVRLESVDVFSAHRVGGTNQTTSIHQHNVTEDYKIVRDPGDVLKEKSSLTLLIERNLYEDMCREVPDISIDGCLSVTHVMLDKMQLELVKGLLAMNLGEDIEEFEKPSTIIHDPVSQPVVAEVWTNLYFRIDLVDVQLEFLQSREVPNQPGSVTRSLAKFDIQCSEFSFISRSNQTRTINLVSQAVIGYDTRYEGCDVNNKPNLFTEVLRPRCTSGGKPVSLQVEIHVHLGPKEIKASIILNQLRLIGVFDLLQALKSFVIDGLPEEQENDVVEDEIDYSIPKQSPASSLKRSLPLAETSSTKDQKPPRVITLKLNVAETDLVVVEDPSYLNSNAVILKGTLVMVLKLNEARIPTVSSSIEKLELFSCYLRDEEETALSILDPVTVGVELLTLRKPRAPPTEATPIDKPAARQVVDVSIPDLNFRLSYRDLKLFVAIAQSLPFFQQSPELDGMSASSKNIYVDNALVQRLLPLGFTRAAIRKELIETNGDLNEAANNLLYQLPDSKAQGVLASIKKEEKKFVISSLEIQISSLSLCLIDDCFNRDVPLLDFTLSDAHIRHHIQQCFDGQLHAKLMGEYYNRNISAWEPVIEPWTFDVSWKKLQNHHHTDNSDSIRPDRILIRVESPEQLCINVTSSLIHLLRRTQEDWKKDLFNSEVDASSSQQELVRSVSGSEQDAVTNETTKMTNIEKGLYLLHSVRAVGQRQKTPFFPFQLLNSTGLPLRFATVSSIPSQVYISASTYPRHSQQLVKGNLRESEWRLVEPDQQVAFDCRINNKMRHKDTRQLVVHQLVVKVAGWKKIAVPVSVDKVGVFFRDLEPSNDDELDTHVQVKGSNRQMARLVFAILLKDNCKIVNIRSGLVIHNKMELPVEIQLKNEQSASGYSIFNMGQLQSNQYKAIPLHLIDWDVHVRPCGLKVQFSPGGLPWKNNSKFPLYHVISCDPLGNADNHKLFRFCANIKREASGRNIQDSNQFLSYMISLVPPFCVVNLLPCEMCLSLRGNYKSDTSKQGGDIVKKGRDISYYEVDPAEKIEFTIHLENFVTCEVCRITKDRVGVVQAIKLTDTKERRLILAVSSELCGGAIKVYISCQYWLINHTGLPLIFKQDGSSQEAAGQFEEHEVARSLQPLLFSYTEPELPEKCSMRLGKGTRYSDRPLWCHRFPMISDTGVRRLFCKQMDNRPDREYQIGVEVKRGRGKLSNSRIVTFVTRYQLENTTQYKIAYLQRHQLKDEELLDASNKIPIAMPGAVVPFHWPRYDLDQLFCIRVKDINHCRWSGGFKLSQTNTFYINMRGAMNRSVFVRVEVILKGATFHVIFSDAANFPPPFRLENLSQVPVLFFQSKVNNPDLYRTLKPSQAVPYSWDEPTLPHFLALQVQGATEAKEVSLMQFGQLGKLYYESYVYIAASATFMKNPTVFMMEGYQKDFPECPEYVLDVPQATAVIFSKKDSSKRSQLWRQSGEGRLVHIASSEVRGVDMVLDISRETISSNKCELLVVRKRSSSRNSTQIWNFKQEGRLVLSEDNSLCVQSRSPNTLKEGADVVLAKVLIQPDNRVPDHQLIGRLKHTPGSGILSLKCSSDGPTRVLTITDENKKYTHLSPRDDWVVVEHGVTAPVRSSCVDQQSSYDDTAEEEEDGVKIEIALSLMLDKGVGVSLINHIPEELVFASLTGLQVDFVYSKLSQQFNANIQHIQVDNQLPGSQTSTPILVFPTPIPSGAADISHPILHMVVERVPHKLPFVTVFRHFTVQLRKVTILLEEKLLFKLLQWLGVGSNPETAQSSLDTNSVVNQLSQSMPGSLRSNQVEREFYFEEFAIADTEFRVSMHTTSQLPDDLQQIKYHLGFPLVKFEAPISLGGYCRHHVIGTADMYIEILVKHYKEVITNQALRIGLSVDFLGNPIGLFNDITSGVTGVLTTSPDVMGLVRDVTHGMSDTTSKLTGAVSDLLGQATFDASYQEEREQVNESCQSSSDHIRAGLIGLSSGVFGGLTSMFTQPVRGAKEDGLGGFITGIGKGVVGTVAKPIAGVFSLASGATAAIRETTSRVSRIQPVSTRLRRCCVGPNGALPCYSLQQARGQEYLWRLNDGNFTELLVSYERLITEPEPMKVIISSDYLYFFQDSPPRPNHLHTKIDLEELIDCRLASSKSVPTSYYITMRSQDRDKPHKFLCSSEPIAQRIVQLIQYAKNLNKERKNVLRTHRLHSHEIW